MTSRSRKTARMDWSLNSLPVQLPFAPRSAQSPGARTTSSFYAPRVCVVICDKAGWVVAELVSPEPTDDVFGVRWAVGGGRWFGARWTKQMSRRQGRSERKGCVCGSLAGIGVGKWQGSSVGIICLAPVAGWLPARNDAAANGRGMQGPAGCGGVLLLGQRATE